MPADAPLSSVCPRIDSEITASEGLLMKISLPANVAVSIEDENAVIPPKNPILRLELAYSVLPFILVLPPFLEGV